MNLLQLGRDIGHKQLVGPGFGNRAATVGQNTGAGRTGTTSRDLGADLSRFCVVDLERLGAHRLQRLDGVARFKVLLVFGSQLIFRGNQQHIAGFTHTQTFGLQNDVQGLIPRHIFQPECDRTRDAVGRDNIEVGEVGNHLQQGACFNILEIQRQFFAGVARAL